MQCNQEAGTLIIKEVTFYKLNDVINIYLKEVQIKTYNIITNF